MQKVLDFFLHSTDAKRFYWNTLAGFLALAAVFAGNLDWEYAPLLFALINGIMKKLNK